MGNYITDILLGLCVIGVIVAAILGFLPPGYMLIAIVILAIIIRLADRGIDSSSPPNNGPPTDLGNYSR